MKKKLIPAILLALLAAGGLLTWHFWKPAPFAYAGTVEATEVDVPARVASTIASLAVDEGRPVTQGQLLASLDGQDYRLAQRLADGDYTRSLALYQSGSIPAETFQHTQIQKQQADLKVQWCSILSPLTGVVLTKYHEPGEWVNPGTRLFTLADLSQVWCLIFVPQPDLARLSYGMKLSAFLPELPGKAFGGEVTHINDQAEFTPKNVQTEKERTHLVYAVKVTFPNPDGLLKPGMTLEMTLPPGPK
ncbi:MAG TPA: efflux RND transporter periplasmic adaptor subunit [bacterium]|nr:efflux RND transporter periplasmic adaptor subunit [bacterium]